MAIRCWRYSERRGNSAPLPLHDARRCGRLNPGAVMRRPDPGEWRPRMPERLDEEELADWRAGPNVVWRANLRRLGRRSRSRLL
jgi:hypothetical protein